MELSEHRYDEPPVDDCDCRRCAIATRNALRAEVERLRKAGAKVIESFEALGRSTGTVELLQCRARCETTMVELKAAVTPNACVEPRSGQETNDGQ